MDKRNMQEYSYAISIPGLIKNAEGKINGKLHMQESQYVGKEQKNDC